MQLIIPPGTRPPAGHNTPAIVHNGLVYVSGQLPIDPVTGQHETGDIAAQTQLVLNNLKRILEAAGSSLDQVLQVTVYTSDVSLWGEINRIYAEFFGNHKPTRAVVPTAPLHYGFLIEIAAIAAVTA
jgi:2-iminobutanoate/2-iminopropanoate deaminase